MEKLYDAFIDAWNKNNDGLFENYGITWIKDAENPFQEGTPERGYFFRAKKGYVRWKMNGIDARYNHRVMVENLKKLAALKLPNPYKKTSVEPEATSIEEPVEEIPEEQVEEKQAEKKVEHILGVLPEEKPKLFRRRKEQSK